MPYNPYSYQQFYPQNYQQNYPQQAQQAQPQPQPQIQPPQPQIQNGGLVSVHNENEARNYPIAIGTSITFKDENAPYVYTKTMGFSQLESPKFDKYRLVKEETEVPQEQTAIVKFDNTALDEIKTKIGALEEEIEGIKKKLAPKTAPKKKEVSEDDE